MNQKIGKYLTNDDSIQLNNGQQVKILDKILQVVDFDEVFIIMIDWTVTNQNVFGISRTGNQLWQIAEQPAIHNDNPCTRLEKHGEYILIGTWDGLELLAEPLTGKIIKERRERGFTTEWVSHRN